MSDSRERELERAAAGGDREAAVRLRRKHCRRDSHRWDERPDQALVCRYCGVAQQVHEWIMEQLRAEAVLRFGSAPPRWTQAAVPNEFTGALKLFCICRNPLFPPAVRSYAANTLNGEQRVVVTLDAISVRRQNGAAVLEWQCLLGRCFACERTYWAVVLSTGRAFSLQPIQQRRQAYRAWSRAELTRRGPRGA